MCAPARALPVYVRSHSVGATYTVAAGHFINNRYRMLSQMSQTALECAFQEVSNWQIRWQIVELNTPNQGVLQFANGFYTIRWLTKSQIVKPHKMLLWSQFEIDQWRMFDNE